MAITFDFAKRFYEDILQSHHGTAATWIDESDVETPIRIFINRLPFEGRSKKFKTSNYNTRNMEIWIANDSVYGRTNIKLNKEKIKFRRDVTDQNEQIFIINNIIRSDKRKIVLAIS